MTTKRRASRLSPEKRTADILVAARQVLAERGYSETIMADIAERAGIVEGSIYRYFRNKRDLMFQMSEDWFEEMIASDEATLQAIPGARNRLRFIVHRHLISIQREPDLSRLVFQHLRPDSDYRETRLFALNRSYTARVTRAIQAGIEANEVRPDLSPSLVRDVIFGSVEHRTWAFLRGEGDFDSEQIADELVDMVWRGLAAKNTGTDLPTTLDRLERAVEILERKL